jgi:hypothetical protein
MSAAHSADGNWLAVKQQDHEKDDLCGPLIETSRPEVERLDYWLVQAQV